MKVKEFKTFDECENYVDSDRFNELIPTIVIDDDYCAIDFTTYCKSWKTAIRRAMKIFANYKDAYFWLEGMKESCENNCFIDKSMIDNHYTGDYTFGVEEVSEGVWYIYLKYKTKDITETSETEEATETAETTTTEESTTESTASEETYSIETTGSSKRKADNQAYNSMCYNCKKFLNGCRGEKNKIYSGCVYKEKMEVRNNG